MKLIRGSRVLACLVVTCVAIASAASADPERPHGGRFGHHGPPPIDRVLERHAEELGLDADVLAQVRTLASKADEQAQPLREALMAQREALHALLEQDEPAPDAVMHQADLVGAAETEMHKQRLRTLLAVRALLTPEQRRELVRIFDEKRHRMRRWGAPPPGEPEAVEP